MVCAGDYLVKKATQKHGVNIYKSNQTIDIEFTLNKVVYWRLGTERPAKENKNKLQEAMIQHGAESLRRATEHRKTIIKTDKRPKTGTFKSKEEKKPEEEQEQLQIIKKLADTYPLDLGQEERSKIDV